MLVYKLVTGEVQRVIEDLREEDKDKKKRWFIRWRRWWWKKKNTWEW